MKMVLVGFFMALFWVCSLMTLAAQDLSSFMERAEILVGREVPSWKLTRGKMGENEANYQWGSAKQGVAIDVFQAASKEDAAEKLRVSIMFLPGGPGSRLDDLGDEAYFWRDSSRGSGGIRFRKSNVYVHLVATSSKLVEDLARSLACLADLIP